MSHPRHNRTIISIDILIHGHPKHPRRQDYPIDENEFIMYIEEEEKTLNLFIVFQKKILLSFI